MSAVLSPCGTYRYRLDREVQANGLVFAFFGINPSTADAKAEDATTKRWRGFCLRNGARRYIAANPFAFRATDVKHLAHAIDPVGPDNLAHIVAIIQEADVLIPCWGNRAKIDARLRYHLHRIKKTILESGKPVKIFGLTKTLDPMHPLMLSYETQLIDWPTP